MTLQDYLNNPLGKGVSLGLAEIKRSLDSQYEELYSNMNMKIFQYKDQYLIYLVQVPSRHAKGLFYQVVYQFDLTTIPDTITDIRSVDFTCFSNCPSFVYTYAKTFKDKEMLCSWSNTKYDKPVLKKNPDIRNTQNLVMYERSLYLAGKFIMRSGKTRIEYTKLGATKTKVQNLFLSLISSQSEIEDKYNQLTKKSNEPKVNNDNKNVQKSVVSHKNAKGYVHTTQSVKNTKTTLDTKKTHKF